MFEYVEREFLAIFLVSIGAIFGSWLRFFLVNKLFLDFQQKYFLTSFVNVLASFLLGLVFSIQFHLQGLVVIERNILEIIMPLITIGFLGGLSTFATFIWDLFDRLLSRNWMDACALFLFSLGGGVLAFRAGLLLMNV